MKHPAQDPTPTNTQPQEIGRKERLADGFKRAAAFGLIALTACGLAERGDETSDTPIGSEPAATAPSPDWLNETPTTLPALPDTKTEPGHTHPPESRATQSPEAVPYFSQKMDDLFRTINSHERLKNSELAPQGEFTTAGGVKYNLVGIDGYELSEDGRVLLEAYANTAESLINKRNTYTERVQLGANNAQDIEFSLVPSSTVSPNNSWEAFMFFSGPDTDLANLILPQITDSRARSLTTNFYDPGISVTLAKDINNVESGLLGDNIGKITEVFHSLSVVKISQDSINQMLAKDGAGLEYVQDLGNANLDPNQKITKLSAILRDWVANSYAFALESSWAGNPYEIYAGLAETKPFRQYEQLLPNLRVLSGDGYKALQAQETPQTAGIYDIVYSG